MTDLRLLNGIKVLVSGARGGRGLASGPLGAGSVGGEEITNDASGKAAIRQKIGAGAASDVTAAIDAASAAKAAIPFSSSAPRNIDLSPRPILRPNRAVIDGILSGSLTICVVGDSIMEPAGISYPNSLAENLQRLMQTRFPWMTINLVNLSIPGRAMSQLANGSYTAPGSFTIAAGSNTSYWPGGSVNGKSWRDHVRDVNADIVVLALGENDGDDVLPFSINYQTFVDYTQTWTKKPWLTLVSGLTPEGATLSRAGAKARADFLLYTAIERGFGSINAAAPYNLLRDGTRRDLVPFVQEAAFQYWGDTSRWGVTGSLALSSGAVSGGGLALRNVAARDIDWAFDFRLTSADSIMRVDFNNRPTESGFSAQADFAGGFLRLYYRGTLQAAPAIPTKANGATVNVRVKRTGPLILVWVDRVLVLNVRRNFGMESGPLAFGTAQGTGTFSNALLTYTTDAVVAQPYFDAAYLLNDSLHHPTAAGAFQTYIPATKQFVDDFAGVIDRSFVATKGPITADASFPMTGTQALTESAVSFVLASERMIPLRIRFGYKNPNTTAATLTLQVDGQAVSTFFLEPTTGANNRQLSLFHDAALSAGLHTVQIVYGAPQGATAEVTSQGDGNTRQLSATVSVV